MAGPVIGDHDSIILGLTGDHRQAIVGLGNHQLRLRHDIRRRRAVFVVRTRVGDVITDNQGRGIFQSAGRTGVDRARDGKAHGAARQQ